MSAPIANLPGNDLKVFESTSGFFKIPCNWYPEQAEVFASEDGVDFFSLGEGCLNEKFDLEVAGLTRANFIRIVDTSNPHRFFGNADGYDVDAVKAIDESQVNFASESRDASLENFAPNEEPSAKMTVMSNPFTDQLRLKINVIDEEIQAQLRVLSTTGEVIFDDKLTLFFGENEVAVDMAAKSTGIYLVKLDEIEGGQEHVIKVMKR